MDKELLRKIQRSIETALEIAQEQYRIDMSEDEFHSQDWYMELSQWIVPIEDILEDRV